jgi:hypothetical protein
MAASSSKIVPVLFIAVPVLILLFSLLHQKMQNGCFFSRMCYNKAKRQSLGAEPWLRMTATGDQPWRSWFLLKS